MKNEIDNEFMPKRATMLSAGYDIYTPEEITLKPGEYTTLDTGIKFEGGDRFVLTSLCYDNDNPQGRPIKQGQVPIQYVGLIFPRSSYGFKYGLRFANSTCIIDQDYRDNIILKMTVDTEVTFSKGERIAQMIFVPWLAYLNEIQPEVRRNGGIGSTGTDGN